MKGLLIDVARRELREVEYEYRNIAGLIGAGGSAFCVAGRLATGDIVLADDEGMSKPFSGAFRIHRMRTDDQPICGNGLVVGRDNDFDSDPPAIPPVDLGAAIEWIDRDTYERWMQAHAGEAAVVLHTTDGSEVLATWGDLHKQQKQGTAP